MTMQQAKTVLLEQPGAQEGSHHGHPDFRVANKVFATQLPDKGTSVLRLPMEMAESQASQNHDRCKVVSRFGGMGWLSIDLKKWTTKEFRPLVELARSLMKS
jgi:hypothetical protein